MAKARFVSDVAEETRVDRRDVDIGLDLRKSV